MKRLIFILIKAYQGSWGLCFPKVCRYYPSCSCYALTAVEKFGVIKGLLKTGARILRCHPLAKGGYDPV